MSSLGNGISEVIYTVLSESPQQNQFPLFIDDKIILLRVEISTVAK